MLSSQHSTLQSAALHTDCYDASIGQFALYWWRLARRRKTRGTSTQVPWHSSDLCPVGNIIYIYIYMCVCVCVCVCV